MYNGTMNAKSILEIFDSMMQNKTRTKVLLLKGEAKMGKTHLLAKEFPELARGRYQALCISIDLKRSKNTTIHTHLWSMCRILCTVLGEDHCTSYQLMDRNGRQDPQVVMERMTAFYSSIKVTASTKDSTNDFQLQLQNITAAIVDDTKAYCKDDQPIVFLIDHVHEADKSTVTWLMDILLPQLVTFSDAKIVVAGRFVPDANMGYLALCDTLSLYEIKDIEEYIKFCSLNNINLPKSVIFVLAVISDHTPGFFVEYLTKLHLYIRNNKIGWGEVG